MNYRVVDTHGWTIGQIEPHIPGLLAAMHKLADRFPEDVTVQSLMNECLSGAKRLWLVLNDKDELVSMAMTRTSVVEATGLKIITMSDLAGVGVEAFEDELGDTVEAWAKEQGAHYAAVEGRGGWARAMKKRGYTEYARLWRKRIG